MVTDALTEAADARQAMVDTFRRLSTLARIIIGGFAVTVALLIAVLGGIVAITADTNEAVEGQVVVLQRENDKLQNQLDKTEATLDVAVDEVIRLATLVQELGGDPGQIRIEPPED